MFEIITINGKDYKCRLNAMACIEAEKRLKTNPINVFIKAADGEAPALGDMLTIFHASLLPYQSNISFSDACDLYDAYCEEEGHNLMTFVEFIVNVFNTAGFDTGKSEGKETKNHQK